MGFGPVIENLIESLQVLPGVGRKSAQRMALNLLEQNRSGGALLSDALAEAIERVGHCNNCRNLSEEPICRICQDTRRDQHIICLIESPGDLLAIEQTHSYSGGYFVLNGSLSPIDGRGPEQIGIPLFLERVLDNDVREVILATNPTIEGEATAHYVAELLSERDILVTRLAHGIPLGGELGYVDGGTLSHAFSGRKPLFDSRGD